MALNGSGCLAGRSPNLQLSIERHRAHLLSLCRTIITGITRTLGFTFSFGALYFQAAMSTRVHGRRTQAQG